MRANGCKRLQDVVDHPRQGWFWGSHYGALGRKLVWTVLESTKKKKLGFSWGGEDPVAQRHYVASDVMHVGCGGFVIF